MTRPHDEDVREVALRARAFVRALDKYEAGLLRWSEVVPRLSALRNAPLFVRHPRPPA